MFADYLDLFEEVLVVRGDRVGGDIRTWPRAVGAPVSAAAESAAAAAGVAVTCWDRSAKSARGSSRLRTWKHRSGPGVEQQWLVGVDKELIERESAGGGIGNEGGQPVDVVGDFIDTGVH